MEIKTPNGTEQEVKPAAAAPAPEVAPVEPAAAVVAPKEATVSEVMAPTVAKEPETVPLAAHLELKNDNKQLRKDLKALEAKINAGGDAGEISDDLAAIGEEFGVDPKFMSKLSSAVDAKVKAAKAGVETELGSLKEEKRAEALDKAFGTHFEAALEAMPEFKDIANREVIKTLSLDPKNANKTFSQIIEETYGNAIQGRRTIEPTVPRGGKEPAAIDYARAATDTTYFNEIMSDPKQKAEYNSNLAKRLKL